MRPGKYNIKFYRATTLDLTVTYLIDNTVVRLNDYTADLQVRESPESATIITEFSTANGGLIINTDTGAVEIYMSATGTALLPIGEYVYDLNVTSHTGVVTKILRGSFVVKDPVTE